MAGLDQEEIDPATGKGITPAAPAPTEDAFADEKVGVITPTGHGVTIRRADLPEALSRGYRLEAPEQSEHRMLLNKEGDRPVQTFIERAAGTMSLGATDIYARATNPEEAARMGARAEGSGDAATAGALFGLANPYGVGGLIGKAGKVVGGAVAGQLGGGVVGRAVGATAAGTTEGALFGYGQGISELALSKDPLTAERVVTTLGGNVLYGAGFGAASGGVGGLLAEGATAGKAAVQKWAGMEEGAAGAAGKAEVAIPEEVRKLDRPAAKAAREVELENIAKARDVEARELYKAAREYDDALGQSWVKGGDKRFERLMGKTRDAIRNSLDSENEFARYKGARTLNALDKQAQALREYSAAAAQKSPAARALEAEEVVKAARAEARVGNGTEVMPRTPAAPAAPAVDRTVADLLEVNDALRKRIEAIGKPPSSPMLDALDAHLDALAHPGKKPLLQQVAEQAGGGLGASIGYHIGGPIGGMAGYALGSKAAAAVLEGGLGAKLAGGVARSREVMGRAAKVFATGAEGAAKAAKAIGPALSTQVLARASFAPPGFVPPRMAPSSNPLVAAYKAREAEIRAQTTMGPNGTPVTTPAARNSLHDRLHALWVVNPQLADMIETAANQRLEFLASKLPARPESQVLHFGPDKWHPGEMDMRKTARYIDATEGGPDAIFERMAHGKMTPEDAEVLRDVYPASMKAMKLEILGHLGELQQSLPYRKRLMLSMLFDVPVERSFEPQMFQLLQDTFTKEPGTEGGTESPKANLGSIKKSAPDPTAAQRMASSS